MTFEKALNRIIWRFEEFPLIKVNENDLEAIDAIVSYVNHLDNQIFLANIPFSKLYAHSLGTLICKYNTTIDNKIVHRELHRILEKPFSLIVSDITEKMNDIVRDDIMKRAGAAESLHPAQIGKEERMILVENMEKLLQDEKIYHYFHNGAWSLHEVESGLKTQIKYFLNSYGIQETKKKN